VDYLAIDQPLPVFEINGDRRFCVDIVVLPDEVTQDEYHEAFLVQLTGASVPLAIGQAVVVILDQGYCILYMFIYSDLCTANEQIYSRACSTLSILTSPITITFLCIYIFADLFYPFGEGAGDQKLPTGASSFAGTTSPPQTLNPRFPFFSRAQDGDTLYVRCTHAVQNMNIAHSTKPWPKMECNIIIILILLCFQGFIN